MSATESEIAWPIGEVKDDATLFLWVRQTK